MKRLEEKMRGREVLEIIYINCDDCYRQIGVSYPDDRMDSEDVEWVPREEASNLTQLINAARRRGWRIGRCRADGEICPDCRK